MKPLLEVRDLVQRYGERTAVDGLGFRVDAGEIYGLLGPNGAGKTTTIQAIAGLRRPAAGHVSVAGFNPYTAPLQARAALGWAGQETTLYPDLTATEHLRLVCALGGVPRNKTAARVAEVLDAIGLSERARERVSGFSGGMKRRLHFGIALVHEPQVLLLDEPLVGIDPQARAHLISLIETLAGEGRAILLTTHDMDDAERLCRRVGILDEGKLLAEGTVEELQGTLGERDILRFEGTFPEGQPLDVAAELDVEVLHQGVAEWVAAAKRGSEVLPRVLSGLEAAGAAIDRVSMERPSLETLFLRLTGRELRDS